VSYDETEMQEIHDSLNMSLSKQACFTCATLASAGISRRRVSVCLSQANTVPKRLNIGSHKQCHVIAHGL